MQNTDPMFRPITAEPTIIVTVPEATIPATVHPVMVDLHPDREAAVES